MKVIILEGTSEEIAKVLPTINGSKEHDVKKIAEEISKPSPDTLVARTLVDASSD